MAGSTLNKLVHEGHALSRIHGERNDAKTFCHFTGFLEGIAASGYIETGEIEPLIAESMEFFRKFGDPDAYDVVEDYLASVLEHEMLADAIEIRVSGIDPACERSALNRFLGFCRGIACDGIVTKDEADAVLEMMEAQPSLIDVIGVKQIRLVCIDAVEDGIVDIEESNQICAAIGEIVGDSYADTGLVQTAGTANFDEFRLTDISVDLEGRLIVVTGSFKERPRSAFVEKLTAYGASIVNNVSAKTDYLVIGGEASRDWIEMHRGTKMQKAQKLRMKGDSPKFVSESQLLRLIKAQP